jgi:hypothetical protein
MPDKGSVLINQRETAQIKQPRDGTERLKPYRWRPGQPSPNPKGRPKEDPLPLSKSYRRALKLKVPKGHPLREEVETTIGCRLPAKATLGDILATMTVWSAIGEMFPKLKLSTMVAVREAVEGKEGPREFTPRETELETATAAPEDLRERILLGFLNVIKRRSELYGIEDPTVKSLARQAIEASGLSIADLFDKDEDGPDQS